MRRGTRNGALPHTAARRRKILLRVAVRDGWLCAICGGPVDPELRKARNHPQGPSLDHKLPVSEGGTNQQTNLQLAHKGCNNRRNTEAQIAARSPAS